MDMDLSTSNRSKSDRCDRPGGIIVTNVIDTARVRALFGRSRRDRAADVSTTQLFLCYGNANNNHRTSCCTLLSVPVLPQFDDVFARIVQSRTTRPPQVCVVCAQHGKAIAARSLTLLRSTNDAFQFMLTCLHTCRYD